MGNFRLFQQARCEVIVKYTNCNLLEQERIRAGIKTLEAQTDEKKNIEAWQSVTGSCKRESVVSIALIALEATVKRREIFAFLEISQNLEAYLQQFIFGKNELLYRYTRHSLLVSKQHHFKGYLLLNGWFCKTRIIIVCIVPKI